MSGGYSCERLTEALFEKLKGATRAQAALLMGAAGVQDGDSLLFFGNYRLGYGTSRAGDTGKLTLDFKDGRVAVIDALLHGGSGPMSYIWSHRRADDEFDCSDLPGSQARCD